MKKTKHAPDEIRKSVANPTTNYPMDAHKYFCKRCMDRHTVCPKTGKMPDKDCTL